MQTPAQICQSRVGYMSVNAPAENCPILQVQIDVPNLTMEQCNEPMAIIPEDIWNLACWGGSDPGHCSLHDLTLRRWDASSLRIGTSIIMRNPTLSPPSVTCRRSQIVQILALFPVASPIRSPGHAPKTLLAKRNLPRSLGYLFNLVNLKLMWGSVYLR